MHREHDGVARGSADDARRPHDREDRRWCRHRSRYGILGGGRLSRRARDSVEAPEARELTFFAWFEETSEVLRTTVRLQNRVVLWARIGGSRLVKNTAIDPLWANSMARVSNHRALRLAKLESRSADYLRRSQLRARRQVAASHTRRRTSPARENTHAARPSRRIREDSGRTLGRDNRERRGFGTGEKTAWASSETTPVTPWWIARPRSRP